MLPRKFLCLTNAALGALLKPSDEHVSLPKVPALCGGVENCAIVYFVIAIIARASRISSFSSFRSLRNSAQNPPFQAFREAFAFPSGVLGPVDFNHGFHRLIASACRDRRSGDHP